jgi:SAM-dependent methyltransferase
MHYVNPRPSAELINTAYAEAEDAKFVSQNPLRIRTFTRVLKKIRARYGRTGAGGMKLLDVGCAGGALLVAARSLGFDAAGVEPGRWLAEFGRQSYGVKIHDGVLEPGMFAPGSFDVITLWDVIEHVPEPGLLLSLIHELLVPDGLLVLSYPDFRSIMGSLLGERWPFWLSAHLHYYDRRTICLQLRRCGFTPERVIPYWVTLELGYALERAQAYFSAAGFAERAIDALGLSHLPLTYNLGQTMVIARKSAAR